MSAEQATITPLPQNETSDAIARRLLEKRATLQADAEIIRDELERIDAQLIEWTGGVVGTHELAGTKVQVREYSRTDLTAIAVDYPVGEYPQLWVMAIDGDAVKAQFSPAALEQYRVRGKKSVVIR